MTIIVPVDFTPTSQNAALYATRLLDGQYGATLLLYHVYYNAEDKQRSLNALQAMKDRLERLENVKVEIKAEESLNFTGSLSRLANHLSATAIIMGINKRSKIEQRFIGSETLEMIRKNVCPVIIVPENAQFKEINKVAFACDFKNITTGIPLEPIKSILRLFYPQLYILNVAEDTVVEMTDEKLEKSKELKKMFLEYNPKFFFLSNHQFEETLARFVENHGIDLLLTIPRHHNFIESLYVPSHTKKLAFTSPVPIVAAHE